MCGLAQFVMRWALMQLILSYNEVAVLRYTNCSILGFMASVREDLVLGFLVALNLVLGGFLGAVSEPPGDLLVALEVHRPSLCPIPPQAANFQSGENYLYHFCAGSRESMFEKPAAKSASS